MYIRGTRISADIILDPRGGGRPVAREGGAMGAAAPPGGGPAPPWAARILPNEETHTQAERVCYELRCAACFLQLLVVQLCGE